MDSLRAEYKADWARGLFKISTHQQGGLGLMMRLDTPKPLTRHAMFWPSLYLWQEHS